MKYTEIKSRLRDIQTIIEGTKNSERLRGTYLEELSPLLESEPKLREEIEKRTNYYGNLTDSRDYIKLIAAIHESLREIAALAGSYQKTFFTVDKRANFDGRVPFTLEEFFADIDDKNRWFVLGEDGYIDDPIGEDSSRCPWRHVLAQYEDCIEKLNEALDEDPDDRLEKSLERYATNVSDLRTLLLTAWEGEKHVKLFEQFFDDLELIKGEWSSVPARMRTSVIVVINDLTRLLRDKERNRFPLKYKDWTFFYKNRKLSSDGQPDYMVLCDVFYPICPKSGKVDYKIIVDKIKERRPNETTPTREKIRELIRSANRWSDSEKVGLGEILKLDKGCVVRLL